MNLETQNYLDKKLDEIEDRVESLVKDLCLEVGYLRRRLLILELSSDSEIRDNYEHSSRCYK